MPMYQYDGADMQVEEIINGRWYQVNEVFSVVIPISSKTLHSISVSHKRPWSLQNAYSAKLQRQLVPLQNVTALYNSVFNNPAAKRTSQPTLNVHM